MNAPAMWMVLALGLGLLVATPADAADAEKGRALFQDCAACHALSADAETENPGPILEGVLGRKAGSREDYRYSAAMRRSEVIWTIETIEMFVADPQEFLRGNRMAYAGIPDAAARADLMAYLEQVLKGR